MDLTLPNDLHLIVMSFLLLPKQIFKLKRDFYNHLNGASIVVLGQIITRAFDTRYITYNENRVLLSKFSKDTTISVINRRMALGRIIFNKCGNDEHLIFYCATYFKKCIANNTLNWTYYCSLDAICIIYPTTYTYNGKVGTMPRKGIIRSVMLSFVIVQLYDFAIFNTDILGLYDVEWASNLTSNFIRVTNCDSVITQSSYPDCPYFNNGLLFV